MRKPNTRDWWEEETAWIEAEGQKTHRMARFDRYCDMQAHFAELDGFPDLATRILAAKK